MRAIIFEDEYTSILTLDSTVFSRIGTFGMRDDLILPHFGALAQTRLSLSFIMTTETMDY